jgi:hypothetical protein
LSFGPNNSAYRIEYIILLSAYFIIERGGGIIDLEKFNPLHKINIEKNYNVIFLYIIYEKNHTLAISLYKYWNIGITSEYFLFIYKGE